MLFILLKRNIVIFLIFAESKVFNLWGSIMPDDIFH